MDSENIANAFVDYLKENDWKYKFNKEKGFIQTGVKLDGKLKQCVLIIDINGSDIVTYGLIDIKSDEENRVNMSELLHRINYGLVYGNFEFDYANGDIRFKYSMDCQDIDLSQDMINRMITYPIIIVNKFGDALLKVLFGLATPEEACNQIKSSIEEENKQDNINT